jgi:DNA repair exonuclease SbcCD ATPase subunit
MIDSIRLENIQSHKDTEIKFDKGINCIVGASDKGKSAIIRGLLWAIENRPLGVEKLGSHWIFNDKGKQINPMSVTIVKDGEVLVRRRSKDENQYIVGDKVLNVVKSDVPQEVSDFFNLSETNIQRQLDSPFLLSETSGEVARYFNAMVKLDKIDKVLSDVDSEKRSLRGESDSIKRRVDEIDEKLSRIPNLDDVKTLMASFDRLDNKMNTLDGQLNGLLDDLRRYTDSISDNGFEALEAEPLIKEYDILVIRNDDLHFRVNDISNLIKDFEHCRPSDIDIEGVENLIKEYESTKSLLGDTLDRKSILNEEISKIVSICEDIEDIDKEIEDKRKDIPKVCPLCGSPIKDENDICEEERK